MAPLLELLCRRLLAFRSKEGRAWASLIVTTFFLMLAATAMAARQLPVVVAGKAKDGKSHAGKTRHRPAERRRRSKRGSRRCVAGKPKRAHEKPARASRAHAHGRYHAHPRKPKKCRATRHAPEKPHLVAPLPSPAPLSPIGIAPALTSLLTVPETVLPIISISAPSNPPSPTSPNPPAPTDTKPPAISGVATEGQTLTASSGEWAGSPTSYVYRWQDCDASGAACVNIAGASAKTHELLASDVGHTIRVVVTAGNAGGAISVTSAATAKIAAKGSKPAKLVDTKLPSISGVATEGQTLTASTGTWTGSPTSYSYQWQDCDSSGAGCASVSGATSSSRQLAPSDVGHTVRVMVTAKNAAGSTSATSAATSTVLAEESSPPPPPPAAPDNTKLPVISGSATEGQTLSASTGTWTESPTSYSYQWQDCNSSGGACVSIGGASAATRKLTSGDVEHTVRVEVTAKNAVGSTSATSAQTAIVTAPVGPQTGCFSAPGSCGYPDPSSGNVGPSAACSSLTPTGNVTAHTAGATIQNMDIKGEVIVSADDVTLTNDCISNEGGGTLGSRAVAIGSGVTGTQITHSDVSGANSTSESVEEALSNNYANADTVADHDYIYNCGECVHGAWTLTNSYVIVNGTVPNCGSECPDHYEDIYCDSSTFVAEHDVLLNPNGQTAALFCDTGGGGGGPAENHITLTGSLVAGGGYSLYPQGNSSSVGSSTMDIANNRFARCLTTPVHDSGTECRGGADLNGYWPLSGYYGLTDSAATYCPPMSGQLWSGNVWDDNNESIGCS